MNQQQINNFVGALQQAAGQSAQAQQGASGELRAYEKVFGILQGILNPPSPEPDSATVGTKLSAVSAPEAEVFPIGGSEGKAASRRAPGTGGGDR